MTIEERDAVELRFYRCPECRRLWAITAAARPVNGPVHERHIQEKLIGKSHFAGARRSWQLCFARPYHVPDDPVLHATYHLGGPEAIEAMNELPAQAP